LKVVNHAKDVIEIHFKGPAHISTGDCICQPFRGKRPSPQPAESSAAKKAAAEKAAAERAAVEKAAREAAERAAKKAADERAAKEAADAKAAQEAAEAQAARNESAAAATAQAAKASAAAAAEAEAARATAENSTTAPEQAPRAPDSTRAPSAIKPIPGYAESEAAERRKQFWENRGIRKLGAQSCAAILIFALVGHMIKQSETQIRTGGSRTGSTLVEERQATDTEKAAEANRLAMERQTKLEDEQHMFDYEIDGFHKRIAEDQRIIAASQADIQIYTDKSNDESLNQIDRREAIKDLIAAQGKLYVAQDELNATLHSMSIFQSAHPDIPAQRFVNEFIPTTPPPYLYPGAPHVMPMNITRVARDASEQSQSNSGRI